MWGNDIGARIPVHTKSNAQRQQLAGKIGHQQGTSTSLSASPSFVEHDNFNQHYSQQPSGTPSSFSPSNHHQQKIYINSGEETPPDYRQGALAQNGGLGAFLNSNVVPVYSTKRSRPSPGGGGGGVERSSQRSYSDQQQQQPVTPYFHPPAPEQLLKEGEALQRLSPSRQPGNRRNSNPKIMLPPMPSSSTAQGDQQQQLSSFDHGFPANNNNNNRGGNFSDHLKNEFQPVVRISPARPSRRNNNNSNFFEENSHNGYFTPNPQVAIRTGGRNEYMSSEEVMGAIFNPPPPSSHLDTLSPAAHQQQQNKYAKTPQPVSSSAYSNQQPRNIYSNNNFVSPSQLQNNANNRFVMNDDLSKRNYSHQQQNNNNNNMLLAFQNEDYAKNNDRFKQRDYSDFRQERPSTFQQPAKVGGAAKYYASPSSILEDNNNNNLSPLERQAQIGLFGHQNDNFSSPAKFGARSLPSNNYQQQQSYVNHQNTRALVSQPQDNNENPYSTSLLAQKMMKGNNNNNDAFNQLVCIVWENHNEATQSYLSFNPSQPFGPDGLKIGGGTNYDNQEGETDRDNNNNNGGIVSGLNQSRSNSPRKY